MQDGGEENDEKNLKSDYFHKEKFDFSSDSDDETHDDSRRKSNVSTAAERNKQLTLQQCGFSRLLERTLGNQDEKSTSLENPVNEHSKIKSSNVYKAHKFKKGSKVSAREKGSSLTMSSDSDEGADPVVRKKGHVSEAVMANNSSSEESDDIVLPTQANKSNLSLKCTLSARAMPQCDESMNSDFECNTTRKKMENIADCGSDYITDESDDIEIHSFSKPKNPSYQRKCNVEKNSQTIDAFSSSENDDISDEKMCFRYPDMTGKTTKYKDLNVNRSTEKLKTVVHRKYNKTKEDESATENRPVNQNANLGSLDGILGKYFIVL